MNRVLFLISIIFLLNGCAETLAFLGGTVGSASSGKIVQSSLNTAISYGVKKQTGKSPLEHAIAYAEEKNPERKKEKCISFIERTKSEFCTIVKKQISLKNTKLAKKTSEIVQKLPKINKTKETSQIENIAKKSAIYKRR
jgi:uncharacterized protein (DUF2344 family)